MRLREMFLGIFIVGIVLIIVAAAARIAAAEHRSRQAF